MVKQKPDWPDWPDWMEYFARQLIMPEWGEGAQEKLRHARVVLVGAGGLGNAIMPYLVGLGIGHITIIDDDTIELSNLARQHQFKMADIGKPKAQILARRARQSAPFGKILAKNCRLDAHNALKLCRGANLIICGTDNHESRIILNRLSYKYNIPLLNGGVSNFDGQIALYGPGLACYECSFGGEAQNNMANCATIGVFTPMVGVVGAMMAVEAGLICAQKPSNYPHHLGMFDCTNGHFMRIKRIKNPQCSVCGLQNET